MTVDNEHWENISAYLSGDLTKEETTVFNLWLQESDDNRLLFKDAQAIWENSSVKLTLREAETEMELIRLMTRIDNVRNGQHKALLFDRSFPWLKIAASVILVITVGYFYLSKKQTGEFVLSSGHQVATLYLPDSSKVWLNSNSTVSYSREFNGAIRNVTLNGEGYFRVKPDSARPFKVITSSTTTVVLGTSFNVKEEDSLTTLTVAQGRVKFFPQESEIDKSIIVKPHEKATFNSKSKRVFKSKNNESKFAAWRKKNNPLYEKEKQNGTIYLSTHYTWKKNQINQSVIEGRIHNKASLATYKNIVLKVTYAQPGGTPKITSLIIFGSVRPGETLDYKRRLLDIFNDTTFLKVSIESAVVASDDEP